MKYVRTKDKIVIIFGIEYFIESLAIHDPVNKLIDKKLIIGSSIFGIGWGLSGLCPGPAIGVLVSHLFPCLKHPLFG